MSWDKQTVYKSTLPTIALLLNQLGIPFSMRERGRVEDMGAWSDPEEGGIPLQELHVRVPQGTTLHHKELVYFDQIQRTHDCDSDDYVVTLCSEDEWWDTPLEIWLDEEEGEEGF